MSARKQAVDRDPFRFDPAPAREGNPGPERAIFVEQVYEIVARIPRGRVTTYGRIARALGRTRSARIVGWALHGTPPERQLPCQRVVNRNGELTGGWHWGHPAVMRDLLIDEGVPFKGEYTVDLERCLWEPESEFDGTSEDQEA